MPDRIREIPYNYTSFSDREIVIRYLGVEIWDVIEQLRTSRRTGRSARMLFEILGDMWVVDRNPFIQDDLSSDNKRLCALTHALKYRLQQVFDRADGNTQALKLVEVTRSAIERFAAWFPLQKALRKKIRRQFSKVTRSCNIDFSGIARVSHVTDASDWRVAYPCVVLSPDKVEELPAIISVCANLDLVVIGRGGGTGYTGAAVPLVENTVVINMEKLDRVGPVELRSLGQQERPVAVISADAGAITRAVADRAESSGYVFAVDPTSMESSTIGGNIAMNAGGKKAVLWGTTLDNLLSWRMVTAEGRWINIERLNHNFGKIHEQEKVTFRITSFDTEGKLLEADTQLINMLGKEFRQIGLGKDVTNKFLGGVPGVQKEGCDGLIASAVFVLHQLPAHTQTICLEFYNRDLRVAIPAIVEIKNFLDKHPHILLSGLEHLDERYVKAVNYASKSARCESPKMVLLIDVSADDKVLLPNIVKQVLALAEKRGAEGFVAVSDDARKHFWADRSRTAAIAAHTNAFKINEDVVIPLDRLADYSEGIERINIEHSIANKIRIITAVEDYFSHSADTPGSPAEQDLSNENREIIENKRLSALALISDIKSNWQALLDQLDSSIDACPQLVKALSIEKSASVTTVIDALLSRRLRISYRKAIEEPLKELYSGQSFLQLRDQLDKIHQQFRSSRLFVATHMHAGDGNVHTNIPVNSNDYTMMREAELIVDRVMKLAVTMGGVISGEHGIGITKLQYLSKEYQQDFARYKDQVDPNHLFNRHKLGAKGGLENAYTPSLRLLQQEALILEASDLGALNDAIRHCLRCGKCKPDCTTHIPRANLNYSPRNKILATGLIIEAFLYEEQTRRGVSVRHFTEMNDIADHCTICHKCLNPCPVDIDFGDVTILMRTALKNSRHKKTNLGARLSLLFLNIKHPFWVKLMRWMLIRNGYFMQRQAYRIFRLFFPSKSAIPKPTTGQPGRGSQIVHFMQNPLPAHTPKYLLRASLGLEDQKTVPIIRDLKKTDAQSEAVFYFPGCGSERLFSQVGLATIAMLYHAGVQTVLPPGYLCCGYPQTASGDEAKGNAITTENRVLFHRVANTLNYLDISTVIVSCGTCMDQLLKYQFDKIFPGCRLLDIHEFLYERDISIKQVTNDTQYLYHDPCHSPMKTYAPLDVVSKLMGKPAKQTPRCCGEAGTFSISRPDIASQARYRKQEELLAGVEKFQQAEEGKKTQVKLLTSCPSCQQGLAAYKPTTGLDTDYIVVELANALLGSNWQKESIAKIRREGIEKVLL